MDESTARSILETLTADRADAEAVVAEASRRVGALRKLIEGYLELYPALASPASADRPDPATREPDSPPSDAAAEADSTAGPRGAEAMLQVMSDPSLQGKYWTVVAMTQKLEERGWLPQSEAPANAVRAALRRLSDQDERVSRGTGSTGTLVYYFSATPDDRPTFAGDRPRLDRHRPALQETLAPFNGTARSSAAPVTSTQEAPMAT